MSGKKLEIFEQAFRSGTGGCRRTCNCGKEYYDAFNTGYSWEDGEIERLESSGAIPIQGSIGDIDFEGRFYVDACNCWHERAEKIMGFLDGHAHKIAEYYLLDKQRKQRIADESPLIGAKEPS